MISDERLAEIAAIPDKDIDISDIPEADTQPFAEGTLMIHLHANQKIRILAMRSSMQRVHPEIINRICSKCSEQVGLFPSSQRVIDQHGDNVSIVCNVCEPSFAGYALVPGALSDIRQSVEKNKP